MKNKKVKIVANMPIRNTAFLSHCGGSMRIHSNNPPDGQAPYCAIQDNWRVSGMDERERAVAASKNNTEDKMDVSGKRWEIASIMAAINRLPDVRDSMVQEIKQSIEAGIYTIDPRKIAEKMIMGL
jgi:flagellar biosynthesis anti-sigma factor FlgM